MTPSIIIEPGEDTVDCYHRRAKGRSLLSFPNDYTIIDLETTGLDTEFNDIIEISCIRFRNRKEIARYVTLVRPEYTMANENENEYFVDEFIEELTGITNDMLKEAPTFPEIANTLWKFLDDEILVGHNIHFDLNFLYDNFINTIDKPLKNNFVDTLRLSRHIFPNEKKHTLSSLAKALKIDTTFHRALADCLTTQSLLQPMRSKAESEHIDLQQYEYRPTDLTTLSCDGTAIVPDHLFYKKHCAFTGKLERFTRKDAAQIVVDIGGLCDNTVTKNTNFLIVVNLDFAKSVKGGKSTKIKKAEKLILEEHQDLKILSEDTFYDLITDLIEKE